MEKTLGKEYGNAVQRRTFLQDNCDKVEEKGYMKRFTPEELQSQKESLTETSIQIKELEDEKKAAAKRFRAALNPLCEQRDTLLENLKKKAAFVEEQCYKFVDFEAREVGYYNEEGDLIESRPAIADELQMSIFTVIHKDGTGNGSINQF